jgi:hypothetical protein
LGAPGGYCHADTHGSALGHGDANWAAQRHAYVDACARHKHPITHGSPRDAHRHATATFGHAGAAHPNRDADAGASHRDADARAAITHTDGEPCLRPAPRGRGDADGVLSWMAGQTPLLASCRIASPPR